MAFARTAAFLLALAGTAHAQPSGEARLAVVGDMDRVSVGQDGYCGAMTFIEEKVRRGILVAGNARTWINMKGALHAPVATVSCTSEISFVPRSGTSYIIRYSLLQNQCLTELFRLVPGGKPEREDLTQEKPRSCLGS